MIRAGGEPAVDVLGVARPAPAQRQRGATPLRVVPGGVPRRRRFTRAVAIGSVITVVALFGVVVFHVLLNQGQMQLDRLHNRAGREHARTERLRLELAALQSPARVVAAARDRLGMVPPAGVAYLVPGAPGRTVAPPPIVPLPAPPALPPGTAAAKPADPPPPPVPGAIFRKGQTPPTPAP